MNSPTLSASTRRMADARTWRTAAVVLKRGAILASVILLGLLMVAYLDVSYRYRSRIVSPDQITALTPRPVAIVFGAGIYPSGRLSSVLADRMDTAIELYQSGTVSKLLLTGDNSTLQYNEPARMGEYARQRGVPESALAYDYAGRRTYDSCWRARHIFGQQDAVLVTQAFHLPRALYTCEQLGIDAIGVSADQRAYRAAPFWSLRESVARMRAWFDVHFLPPQVIGGDPIDIS